MIKVGISPCPNDIFNFFGLLTQKVSFDQPLEFTKLPLHELNAAYYGGEFDFIKVSSIPHLLSPKGYKICPLGGAFTAQNGPLVLAKKAYTKEELSKLTFGVAGKDSTAAMLLKVLFKSPKIREIPFSQIISAVQKGEVQAGVVIHESRSKPADFGLVQICDLTKLWYETYETLTPLAIFVAKTTLSENTVRNFMGALTQSYDYALEHKEEALDLSMEYSQMKDKEVLWEHVKNFSLYSHNPEFSTSELLASFRTLVEPHLSQALRAVA